MTNDSRDLDCACAEAMGWTTKEFSSATALVRGKELVWQPPRYSTDPSTQAEKLRWLHENVPVGYWPVLVGPSCGRMIGKWDVDVTNVEDEPLAQAEGATIDEALARLIVVLAKAKKEQKP